MTGRPLARFCKWGHDTYVTGRDSSRSCRVCRRLSRTKPTVTITLEDVERDLREMRERVAARRKGVRVA